MRGPISSTPTAGRGTNACCARCWRMVLPRPALFRLALLGARIARPFARLIPERRSARQCVRCWPARERCRRRARSADRACIRAGRAARARGAAGWLRAAGAGAGDQRGYDPPADAAWRRGGGAARAPAAAARSRTIWASMRHAMASARANIAAWSREIDGEGLDAIVINASGCGTTVKDYGFMFRTEPELRSRPRRVAARACDISEYPGAYRLCSRRASSRS